MSIEDPSIDSPNHELDDSSSEATDTPLAAPFPSDLSETSLDDGEREASSTDVLTPDASQFLDLLETSETERPFDVLNLTLTSASIEHGDAISELNWYNQQSANGLCDPASVAMVVAEFKGIENNQALELFVAATAVGVGVLDYDGESWSGVPAEGTVKELAAFGIESHIERGGDIPDLAAYLDQDRSIILTVDSSEFWEGVSDDFAPEDAGGDHAVVITGIDLDEELVYVNDPGDPEGAGRAVPWDVFNEAWEDSNYEMVVTDEAPGAGGDPLPGETEATNLEGDSAEPAQSTQAELPDYDRDLVAAGVGGLTGAVILPIFLAGGFLAGKKFGRQSPPSAAGGRDV